MYNYHMIQPHTYYHIMFMRGKIGTALELIVSNHNRSCLFCLQLDPIIWTLATNLHIFFLLFREERVRLHHVHSVHHFSCLLPPSHLHSTSGYTFSRLKGMICRSIYITETSTIINSRYWFVRGSEHSL